MKLKLKKIILEGTQKETNESYLGDAIPMNASKFPPLERKKPSKISEIKENVLSGYTSPEEAKLLMNPSHPRNLSKKKHGSKLTDYEKLHGKLGDDIHQRLSNMSNDSADQYLQKLKINKK